MIERGFCHEKIRVDICTECSYELLGGDLLEIRFWMLFTGVVDENVERAEFLHGAIDRLVAKSFVGNVARDREAAAILVLDQPAGLLGIVVLFQINNRDVRAFASEMHGNGAANT